MVQMRPGRRAVSTPASGWASAITARPGWTAQGLSHGARIALVAGRLGARLLGISVIATVGLAQVAQGSSTRPVLAGPWARYQTGYGHVEPPVINNGGDPTGVVTAIQWTTWGGPRAVGTGRGWYVGPKSDVAGGSYASAQIVLFHLGTCKGRAAYDAVEWYFPDHGQHFNAGNYINACTGAYYTNGKPDIPTTPKPAPKPKKPSSLDVHDFNHNTLAIGASLFADPATPTNQFYRAAAGSRLVAIKETLTDDGPGGISSDVNSDTTLVGSDGQAYTPSSDLVEGCTNFDYGAFTLTRGESEDGCVVFAVPDGVTVKRVTFSLTGGAVDTVQWTA